MRIIVVGDGGVGKSSLVYAMANGTFEAVVESKLAPQTINSSGVLEEALDAPLIVVDTDEASANRELGQADAVILVHSGDADGAFERTVETWVPRIAEHAAGKPIVLSPAKADGDATRGDGTEESLSSAVGRRALQTRAKAVMEAWPAVEACIVTSAKEVFGVQELLKAAALTVACPTRPLFDVSSMKVTPAYTVALERIFRIFDADMDGMLSEEELSNFQSQCFNVQLTASDLRGLKEMLRERDPAAVRANRVTFWGFVLLHREFILRNKQETNWKVLSKFGYSPALRLHLDEHRWRLPPRARADRYELNSAAEAFLNGVFSLFANENAALGEAELAAVFRVCAPYRKSRRSTGPEGETTAAGDDESPLHPFGPEFPARALVNAQGQVTRQGWLAQWSMLALLDVQRAARYLHLLGFGVAEGAAPTTGLRVCRCGEGADRRGVKTFHAFVFGAAGCGKSSLLDALVNRRFQREATPTARPVSVVGEVQPRDAQDKRWLVCTEWPAEAEERGVRSAADCDIALLCYDVSSRASLEHAIAVQHDLPRSVPVLFVALKTDLHEEAPTDPELNAVKAMAEKHAAFYSLDVVGVSVAREKPAEFFRLLTEAAIHPEVARPVTQAEKLAEENVEAVYKAAVVLGAVAVGGALCFAVYRALTRSK